MKSVFKKALALFCAVCLLLTFAACGGKGDKTGAKNDGYTANNTTFKIGVSGPLTGGAAVYGVAVKNAAQMAIDEINEAGGLDGVKFELLAYDDVHDTTKVEANYAAMYEAGMQLSLGCVTSNPCLEFSAFAADDNVFFLTPSASNADVPAEDNAYQMCFADGNQGKVAADFVTASVSTRSVSSTSLTTLTPRVSTISSRLTSTRVSRPLRLPSPMLTLPTSLSRSLPLRAAPSSLCPSTTIPLLSS